MKHLKIKTLMMLLAVVAVMSSSLGVYAAYVPPPQLVPGVDYNVPNYANSPPLTKFVDSLPGLTAAGINNLGQYIPVAQPMGASTPAGVPTDGDYYEIALVDYQEKMHTDLQPTTLRGYVQIYPPGSTVPATAVALNHLNGTPILYGGQQVYGYDKPHYLGPTIVANHGTPTRVKFYNLLATTANGGNLFIPTDVTVMGAGMGPDGSNYSQNRATLHLHGGDNPWISDGTAHQWITPAGEAGALLKGASQQNVPDMPLPASGAATFYWPNGLSGRLMFYHDHALGTTRLDVYAGEAAGYLLVDPSERALNAMVTGGEIPLVIQDKTFVNDGIAPVGFPAGVAAPQATSVVDPLWASNPAWGQTQGSLWFPHVYMPNQNPNDLSGANPFGRWDYGAWFWPVFPSGIPPQTSTVPESFMDTPLVNGTAYPKLAVDPKTYRFRVLNASNDRFWNLQLYLANPIVNSITVTNGGSGYKWPPVVTILPDPTDLTGKGATAEATIDTTVGSPTFGQVTGITVTTVGSGYTAPPTIILSRPSTTGGVTATATANLYTGLTEVGMVPASMNAGIAFPPWWYANDTAGMIPNVLDGRMGGVPDPDSMGPSFIHIGSEAGLSPAASELLNTPIGYEQNKRSVTVLNTLEHTLFLGPAERADVVVDFSQFAGKTLILYNDSPAPVPAGDPRNDYYTHNPDNTFQGGAPSTVAGFGPNTRTVMQINVSATTADPIFVPTTLDAPLAAAFAATQPAPIVPANTYARISDTSMTINGVATPMQPKTIQELFDPLGRMNSTLGVEVPFTTAVVQTTIPYGFADPATEVFNDGATQLWKITHNGVDTHALHFHLFDVQLVNRVGWDGAIKPPFPEEMGWKDTVKMNPLEDVVVALHAKIPTVPFKQPNSVRALDPTQPLGVTTGFLGVDPNNNPVTVVNRMANFGNEYTWHCHLLGHEENDMMRAVMVAVAPETPSGLTAATSGSGATKVALINWTNNALNASNFILDRATNNTFTSGLVSTPLGNVTSYTDPIGDTTQSYYYRVSAANTVGSGVAGFPSATATSGFSNVAGVNLIAPPAAPTSLFLSIVSPTSVQVRWSDRSNNETGFEVWRSVNGGATALLTTLPANTQTYLDGSVSAGNTYSYQVRSFNAGGASAFVGPATIAVSTPNAPTNLLLSIVSATSVQVRWTDRSTNETGYEVWRSVNGGAMALLTTLPSNTVSYLDGGVSAGNTYGYQVRAFNLAGPSAFVGPATIAMLAPAAPSGFTAQAWRSTTTSDTVTLRWTDNSNNEGSFTIERATDPAFTVGLTTSTVPANTRTASQAGLPRAASYYYRIQSVNIIGTSAWVNATPFPVVTP